MPVLKYFRKAIKYILPYFLVREYQKKNQGINAYYCRALTGISGYNISINSDMSVSCNCQDWSGEGIIGKLDGTNTFESVFLGEKANGFRTKLADGKLPINICSGCCDLRSAPKYIAEYYRKNIAMPVNGIMVEACSSCNYNCKYCSRKELNKRASKIMSLDDIKYIANELKENKIKSICLFKLGEPFFDNDIYKKLKIIKEINPNIVLKTSTNGLLIDSPEKVASSLLFDYIYFSIDGINTEMQNKYQRGADFEKIIKNVKQVIKERGSSTKPILAWKYVVFSWNDAAEHIKDAFLKAAEVGFDRLIFTEGGVENKNDKTKRYSLNDFIPEDIQYKLITYDAGYGMEFDMHNKTGI